MKVSIVILNWNGEKFLRKFLPVLINNSDIEGAEIVVADNASTDGSIGYINSAFPEKVKTLLFDKNYGFAGGYNKALENNDAEYYILLNSDVEVADNWLEPLLQYMDNNPDVAACQPKLLSYSNKDMFEYAGAAGGFIDYLGYPYCRGRIFGKTEKDKGQYDSVTDIFWATGACFVVRSRIFNLLGGFDSEFFAHMEEIDLCWRMRSRNMRIVCVPESKVYHVGGGALNAEHPRKTYLNFRNNLLLLYKNLPAKRLNKVLFVRMILDQVAALQMFLTGKPANAASIYKARADFELIKKRFTKKRNQNILYATNVNIKEMLQKSILVEYYLKWKKTYSKLVK